MEDKPIHIDFDIENMLEDGQRVIVPKFAKAMVRIAQVISEKKKKVLVAYPNYFCRFTSLLMVGSYFHFMTQRRTRTGIRILVVSKSVYTLSDIQRLSNSFGTPFVDFVYTGHLSKQGFRRLKPFGSGRGSAAAKLDMKHANIVIVRPGYVGQVLDQHFDLCIIEDCQVMMNKRYFFGLERLIGLDIPILALLTVPDSKIVARYIHPFGFRVVGWDESLLSRDARKYKDQAAFGFEETYYPSVSAIELPLDDFHGTLNLAWNAYAKSRKLAKGVDNEILNRTFIEIGKIMHSLMQLPVPWELFGQLQEAAGKAPLVRRLAIARTLISQLPRGLSDKLELETVLNIYERALSLTSTKEKYYRDNLGEATVHFVATPDEITAQAMKAYFVTKRGLNIVTPDTQDQIRKNRVLLNGLTGKIAEDYRTIKQIRTERLDVLVYSHEKPYLDRLNQSRTNLSTLLDKRLEVFKELGIIN